MTTRKTPRGASPSREADGVSERTTIPASDVGVTLRISDEALREARPDARGNDQGCAGGPEVLLAMSFRRDRLYQDISSIC